MSRQQEILKLRAKINQIETKKTIQRISKNKRQFFKKINTIGKSLAKLTKGHKDSIQIIKNKKKRLNRN